MSEIAEISYIFSPAGRVSELSGSGLASCCLGPGAQAGRRASRRAYRRGKTQAEKRTGVSKVFKRTTHYNSLGMTKKDLNCFDDSNAYGEYFSLDLNVWEELSFSIDEHKRINIGRSQAGEKVRLFVLKDFETFLEEMLKESFDREEIEKLYNKFKEPVITDDMIGFNRRVWVDLRRVRGENRGQPLEVNANGTIWIGDRAEPGNTRIFTRRG